MDDSVGTHPIVNVVEDTDAAVGIFDAITYCKGNSVLNAFFSLLGEDVFKAATHEYFTVHQYENAD